MMNKQHMFAFLDRLERICDEQITGGYPLKFVYLEEFRKLHQIVAYYYSVCKDAV